LIPRSDHRSYVGVITSECAFKMGDRQKVMRIKIVACNVDFHIKKKSCNPTYRTRDIAFLLNGKNAILNWPPLQKATLLKRLSWFFVIRITSPNISPSGALSRQIIPKNSNFHYGLRTSMGYYGIKYSKGGETCAP